MYVDTTSITESPLYRYTIQDANGKVLRKGMDYARFLEVRPQYRGRKFPVRVVITHMEHDDRMMYDLSLTRWIWSS